MSSRYPKFSPGEEFVVSQTGLGGKITKITYDKDDQGQDISIYWVEWDSRQGQSYSYSPDEVDMDWERKTAFFRNLPMGLSTVGDSDLIGDIGFNFSSDVGCSHSWKNYQGLREAFDYCEKCDVRKS